MFRMLTRACRRDLVLGIAAFALAMAWLAVTPSAAGAAFDDTPRFSAPEPVSSHGLPDLRAGERHDGIVRRTAKRLGGAESSRSDASGDKLPDVLHAEDNPGVFISSRSIRMRVAVRRPAVPAPGARFLSRAPPAWPAM